VVPSDDLARCASARPLLRSPVLDLLVAHGGTVAPNLMPEEVMPEEGLEPPTRGL
jgi:hypothetical protein